MLRTACLLVVATAASVGALVTSGAGAAEERDHCYGVMASPLMEHGEAIPSPQQTACRFASPGEGHSVKTLSWEKRCGRSTIVVRLLAEVRNSEVFDIRVPTTCALRSPSSNA